MTANQELQSDKPNCVSFCPPPLLEGEDPKAYDDLLASVTGAVKPSDAIEEILANDVVDFAFEGHRWRRLIAILLTAKMTDALELALMRPLNLPPETEFLGKLKPNPAKTLAQEWAAKDPSAIKRVDELLLSVGATIETVQARALELAIRVVGDVHTLAMSAMRGRNSALRELDRHRDRKAFVRAQRDKVHDIEDAKFSVETKTMRRRLQPRMQHDQ
ncbi:MAG TPA: hypothetical protein VFF31_25945 [Blastocatellia bacterium]|nr:hypothetical protein [Blastocatellia bacterium]